MLGFRAARSCLAFDCRVSHPATGKRGTECIALETVTRVRRIVERRRGCFGDSRPKFCPAALGAVTDPDASKLFAAVRRN